MCSFIKLTEVPGALSLRLFVGEPALDDLKSTCVGTVLKIFQKDSLTGKAACCALCVCRHSSRDAYTSHAGSATRSMKKGRDP